tara:strand:+ start:69 stop:431 length:363 start_codon:yes stop_codon:yes gene_type:complete
MANQLLNIRNSYKFPEYIDIKNIPDTRSIEYGIKKILFEEFGVTGDVDSVEKIFDNKISSDGQFTSVVCLDTGDLHLYALDVEKKEVGFELIPKVMYFSDAIVHRWNNIMEIDNVKFDFY